MNTLFKTVTSLQEHRNQKLSAAPEADQLDAIFIKDMVFKASIGVYEDEKKAPQNLKANIIVHVSTSGAAYQKDDIQDVMSYEYIVQAIEDVKSEGHIHLLESFAERLAQKCLNHPMALDVDVTLEKENMFGYGEMAGVRITRKKYSR